MCDFGLFSVLSNTKGPLSHVLLAGGGLVARGGGSELGNFFGLQFSPKGIFWGL